LESGQGPSTPSGPGTQPQRGQSQPPPQRERGALRRVLLLANEAVSADAVLNQIVKLAGGEPAEVFVVAPALTPSRLKHAAGDVDEAIETARLRLDASLEALCEMGFVATGEIGDSEPNVALEDAIRRFPADEVVIATHPRGQSKWLEWNVIEKARSELAMPVTHVVVDA
jgi:hypothetical protein